MKKPFLFCSIFFVFMFGLTLLVHAVADAEDRESSLRIKLERREKNLFSFGSNFDFEKTTVDKMLDKYKVKLPVTLSKTAKVGIGPRWLLFAIMQKIPGKSAVELILDRNSNFDLTDDEALTISSGWDKAQIQKIKRTVSGPQPRFEWLPYLFAYIEESGPGGEVQGNIFMNAGYGYYGEFRLASQNYSIQVDDNGMNAVFKKDELPDLSILIQAKNGSSGKSYSQRSIGLFPIGNDLYSMRGIAEDGSWIEFKKSELKQAFLGRPAPDMVLTDTEEKAFKVSDYRGKALLLNFWTTWCKPCLAKFPDVKKTILFLKEKPFAAIGINLDDETRAEVARKLIREQGLSWRQVVVTTGWTHPLYQVYGRLPEWPMAFPVYVLIDKEGLVRYATNDFLKMEACLAAHFASTERVRDALFIPMGDQMAPGQRPSHAIDFSTAKVQSFMNANKVKIPAGLRDKARIGMMPNGMLAIARPGPTPGKILLTLDTNRDLDLAGEESKEIPMLSKTGGDVPEAVEMQLKIKYASGAMRFASFGFFARPAADGRPGTFPEIRYIGQAGLYRGAFHAGREEYELEIEDPTGDWIITPEDAGNDEILKLKMKKGTDWVVVHKGIRHIPIAGSLYSLRQVWEDGMLAILEKEN